MEGVLVELGPCSRVHRRRLRLRPHPERRASTRRRPRAIDFPLPTPRYGSRPGTGRSMSPSVAHRVGGPGVGCSDCDRRHHGGRHCRGPPASVGVRVWCPVDVSRRRPDSGGPRSEVQTLSLSLARTGLLSPTRARTHATRHHPRVAVRKGSGPNQRDRPSLNPAPCPARDSERHWPTLVGERAQLSDPRVKSTGGRDTHRGGPRVDISSKSVRTKRKTRPHDCHQEDASFVRLARAAVRNHS